MINIYNCAEDATLLDNYDKEFNKVAKIHKYWSRKPFQLVENCILKYTKENEIVLDPFCGSGSTGLGSVLNNRQYIGYDLNPTAVIISNLTLDLPFDEKTYDAELNTLIEDIKDKILDLYSCKNGYFILYSLIGKVNKDYNAVIADKYFKNKKRCCLTNDLLIPDVKIPEDLQYPDMFFPEKFYKDRFSYKGVRRVSDMFTKRNLYALALLYNYIENSNFVNKEYFRLAFSNTILHVSKLKSENVRPLSVNNYWLPDDCIEENVIWRFIDRAKNVKEAKKQVQKKATINRIKGTAYKIYNKSSIRLEDIEDNSIDYIITDPPYGDAIQYSELSYIWNCWFNKIYSVKDELIINPVQLKGNIEFKNSINTFISNAYRVLKNNSKFTLCFQNKDINIWLDMILHIKSVGFSLEDIKIYDTFGSPYNKHWAKFSPKADLYVTFKKETTPKREKCQSKVITPDFIINDILRNVDSNLLDMNRCYDFFVASVINEIFKGKTIGDIKDWNLKKIVGLYEKN